MINNRVSQSSVSKLALVWFKGMNVYGEPSPKSERSSKSRRSEKIVIGIKSNWTVQKYQSDSKVLKVHRNPVGRIGTINFRFDLDE